MVIEREKVVSDNTLPTGKITEDDIIRAEFQMMTDLRKKILRVIDEVDKGFRRVMLMYTIAFFVGVAVVLFSIISTVVSGTNMFTLIFGAIGALDVVAFFVFKPAEDLQKSRANLAQLVAAFMAWNNDMRSWAEIKQKKIKDGIDNTNINTIHDISRRMMIDTVATMMAIDIFVEGKQMESEVKRFQEIIKMFHEGMQT
jgi:hypothetical protein